MSRRKESRVTRGLKLVAIGAVVGFLWIKALVVVDELGTPSPVPVAKVARK